MNKKIPFDELKAEHICDTFGTPVYVYDENGIRTTAKQLNSAFHWAQGYKNYFAVKALPNPTILMILYDEGMGFDCSSRAELELVKRLNITGEDIFFTSNNTPKEDFKLAIELGATVNIDDLTQVEVFCSELAGKPLDRVAVRYNPGNLTTGNDIIGKPEEAKYGMSAEQVIGAFSMLKQQKIKSFGLHAMVASNELSPTYFQKTANLLLDLLERVELATDITISFVNLGGGFGIPYGPEQKPLDILEVATYIEASFKERSKKMTVYTESGRYVTGPHGYLLTKVRYVMKKHKMYVGVDASMHNLMRPGMYGAYHHITILGKPGSNDHKIYDVVGSLCENNDKFAIDRSLPNVEPGDLLVIHDAGAHAHAMGFNYNGLLRSAEVLLQSNGEVKLIRRAETLDDYFSTLVWP